MITPRRTRLVRTPDLRAFHAAIAALACDGGLLACRRRAVIVPTRAAAGELRRTIENHRTGAGAGGPTALALPDLVTRDDWYRLLHRRLGEAPPVASEFEREVLFGRAARQAAAAGAPPPFPLRPGLVVEMLALYDELHRRHRTIDAFERLLVGSLEPSAELDRGASRLLAQTRFLVAAFRAQAGLIEASGRLDEHALRARLLARQGTPPLGHVVVTVPDQNADPHGLWPADYDLLARLPGLERVDVVATEETLATGFLERVHDLLPGIEPVRSGGEGSGRPLLVAPPADLERPFFLARDREEELVEAVRRMRARGGDADASDRRAIVFQRPLPYVYLARQVFGAARLPYQTLDALPLAAEPYAAALDLVISAATSGFTRGDTVALLRSPHFLLAPDGAPLEPEETAAFDRVLRQVRYFGDAGRLADLAGEIEAGALPLDRGDRRLASRAARAAAAAARALAPLLEPAAPTVHLAALEAFLERHGRPCDGSAWWHERHLRAHAAVRDAIAALARAHADQDDEPGPFDDVAAALRRWIEGQTFSPRTGDAGPHLVDATAARYGDFDEVHLVGLVERDWPEAAPRNIFYPASLLVQLGWPAEPDRASAARAAFRDLLGLAASRLALSTFTLEDDAVVRPSPLLEEVEDAGLALARVDDAAPPPRIFVHEALMEVPVAPAVVEGLAAGWLALRLSRADGEDGRFRGATGPRAPAAYRVSALERYLDCPFKYFAGHVLRIEEERGEEPGLSALERGRLVHEVFETFFTGWQAEGRGAITPANLSEALDAFTRVAEARLGALPEADRALERARLLGSAVASGLGARAFEFEVESDQAVVERLLEHTLEGIFTVEGPGGPRSVELRGKADRIDLLADATLRLVDYKLGRAPKAARALQLPVYGVCAEQRLRGRHGLDWTFGAAGYLAFGERQPFVSLAGPRKPFAAAVAEGIARLAGAVDGIERGEFPVRPDEPFLCTYCAYPSVCRKDYVGDE